jgi:membrane associated rhomboid family serine protease
MRDAAVGFHCPTCVAEGAKATRSGRTAYGGIRPGNPGLTTSVLIAINAFVWLTVMATGGANSRLVDLLALRPNGLCAVGRQGFSTSEAACAAVPNGAWLPGVSDGAYWQLMTSAFTHVQIMHFAFNMFALWVLGPQLEMAVGRLRFLALYLLSALSGSAFVYWFSPQFTPTLGASGAVFGLMGALLVLSVKVKANPQQILFWIALNFVFTFLYPNISWQGHLGGFLGGALIAAALVYAPRPRRTFWQALGLGAITVVLLASIVARTAVLT